MSLKDCLSVLMPLLFLYDAFLFGSCTKTTIKTKSKSHSTWLGSELSHNIIKIVNSNLWVVLVLEQQFFYFYETNKKGIFLGIEIFYFLFN